MLLPRLLALLLLLPALLAPLCLQAADDYQPGPDAQPKDGVPKGAVSQHRWNSEIFPGTVRDYWVYVPAQYEATKPAAVLICQDGAGFVRDQGPFRAPTVLDNLIHAGDIPVTIGIFINPGVIPPTREGGQPRKNRSFEYDTLSDQYARFLIEELLPAVEKDHGVTLTDNPDGRVICGNSSGGICAFTAAWERPDAFRRVISHIGSFTNIRGGHVYPALIRKTEPKKPLRVFLQDGENDLDNLHGNWPLANRQMAAALAFAGYDHEFVMGTGAHSAKHGGAIFPDTLRWIWRDWKELSL